jgi:glucan phosphoethanolaminetransferase (alkaline phosphatase superfamily)
MYDNSILYTDYILSSIIAKLGTSNAILFFTSDHGESLGENGMYGHGGSTNLIEQTNVPFFVWTSDKFNKKHPQIKANLAKNQGKNISYKYLFHSIFDCANIQSDIVNHNLSLCR